MEQIMEHNIDPPVQQILRTPFAKLCMNSVFYPMNFARILIQLGHDPFPLSRGKKRIFFGPPVYFQPNFFKYIKNIWQSHGWPTVYTGIGAHLAHSVAFDLCYKYTVNQLDEFYPELGGRMDEEDKQKMENPRELGTHQLIRVRVRQAIRDTVSHCISTAIVQPFWVIMVRQIAQHIGNDTKYAPIALLQPLRLIGDEEGPSGLFSGLIPQLIGVVFFVWGSAVLSIVVEEVIKYSEKDQDLDDQQIESYFTNLRSLSKMVVGYFIRGWRYPFEVVAAIMATAGSRLAVSMLPFSPLFTHWSDAYDYLSPFELYRGNQVILRQERGPVSVGTDGKLYASKKHFI